MASHHAPPATRSWLSGRARPAADPAAPASAAPDPAPARRSMERTSTTHQPPPRRSRAGLAPGAAPGLPPPRSPPHRRGRPAMPRARCGPRHCAGRADPRARSRLPDRRADRALRVVPRSRSRWRRRRPAMAIRRKCRCPAGRVTAADRPSSGARPVPARSGRCWTAAGGRSANGTRARGIAAPALAGRIGRYEPPPGRSPPGARSGSVRSGAT